MRSRDWKIFQEDIPVRSRIRLQLIADDYCSEGPDQFDMTDFRFLGHLSYERISVRLEEFKAPQVRLFGFMGHDEGIRTFFVTGIDPSKKRRKAKKGKLDAALKEAARVTRLLS